MGRFFAALLLCALLLTGLAQMKEKAQPVFFSLLFEQLLPEWMLGEATAGEAEETEAAEGACAWL